MPDNTPVGVGDRVPHFELRDVKGRAVRYTDIWQHRNVVVVAVPEGDAARAYVGDLHAKAARFDQQESTCVITSAHVPGLKAPGVLVADRWGEIVHVVTPPSVRELPPADLLLQWLEAIEHRCPECEGEAR